MAELHIDDNGQSNALLALLSWYHAMGVDAAVSSKAVNWLAHGKPPPSDTSTFIKQHANFNYSRSTEPPLTPTSNQARAFAAPQSDRETTASVTKPFVATISDAGDISARKAAFAAENLQSLRDALAQFEGCGLKATAKNLCFFRGAEQARVMVIGEAPGREEDRSGTPFVGRAGQLLDKMLQAIGLDESLVHITNAVYWRPPGNRTPTPQETLVCKPFLQRQIDLVAPAIIITVGGPATKTILDQSQGIMKLRGKWRQILTSNGTQVQVMPTLHPAYLLRTPGAKRLVWRDLCAVKDALQGTVK